MRFSILTVNLALFPGQDSGPELEPLYQTAVLIAPSPFTRHARPGAQTYPQRDGIATFCAVGRRKRSGREKLNKLRTFDIPLEQTEEHQSTPGGTVSLRQ